MGAYEFGNGCSSFRQNSSDNHGRGGDYSAVNDWLDMHTQQEEEESATPKTSLSENTTVRIGLVLSVMGLIFGGVITVIAIGSSKIAEFSTKLDNLTSLMTKVLTQSDMMDRKVNDHINEDQNKWTAVESRLGAVEKNGSDKTREIEKSLNDLRRDFQVHEALGKVGVK